VTTRAAVAAEAWTWLATPYHPHGRIKGVGVDCAMLLAEVFERVGMVPRVDAGDYPPDWHLNHSAELFLQWLLRVGAREVDAPGLGDVGLFRYGHTHSHGAIVVGPDLLLAHAYIGRGVVLGRPTEEPLSGHRVRWFTLFESGQ